MRTVTTTKFVAIEPIKFTKVEAKIEGGFARIAQKIDVISVPLVLGYLEGVSGGCVYHHPFETKVLVMGESALAPWNKMVLEYNGIKFVKCPLTDILGFEEEERKSEVVSV